MDTATADITVIILYFQFWALFLPLECTRAKATRGYQVALWSFVPLSFVLFVFLAFVLPWLAEVSQLGLKIGIVGALAYVFASVLALAIHYKKPLIARKMYRFYVRTSTYMASPGQIEKYFKSMGMDELNKKD